MPNKKAKDKKRKRRLINIKLNKDGRTANQIKRKRKKLNDKKCSSCKKYKFKWKYNKNRTKRDGLQHQCRPCQHEYHNKQWYPKNKKDRLKSVKKYKWERRQDNYRRVIKEYFVKGCVDCGESNVRVLEFDHVRGEK